MSRFDTPVWRLVGSLASWGLFAFFFLGLFQAAGVVLGLGGYCASGGPYVIETECPQSVIVFAPVGTFGMFAAAGVAIGLARGFGVSLLAWAWPILFVGLGIQFLVAIVTPRGVDVSSIVVGVLFVAMGLAPVWLIVKGGSLAPTLVGSRGLTGARFAYGGTPRRYFGLTPTAGDEIAPTARDWALSLGTWAVGTVLGAWLSLLAFAALAANG